jgi:hypothetical protein
MWNRATWCKLRADRRSKDHQKRVAGGLDLFALRKLTQRLAHQCVVLSEELSCGAVA